MHRLADLVTGHMKPFILCMNVGCILSTFGFLMIAEGYIPYSKSKWQLLVHKYCTIFSI